MPAKSLETIWAIFWHNVVLNSKPMLRRPTRNSTLDHRCLTGRSCLIFTRDLGRSRAEWELRKLEELDELSRRDLKLCTDLFEMIKGCSMELFEDRLEMERMHPTMTQEDEDRLPF